MTKQEYLSSSTDLNTVKTFKLFLEAHVFTLEEKMTSGKGIPRSEGLSLVQSLQSYLAPEFWKQELTFVRLHISSMLEVLKAQLQQFKPWDDLSACTMIKTEFSSMISWIQDDILQNIQENDTTPTKKKDTK